MNCLEFAIRYKLKHNDAKIKFEHYLFMNLKKHGLSKSFFRYFRYIGLKETILIIFIPHFYVLHNNVRLEVFYGESDDYNKKIIENPRFISDRYNIDLDDFRLFLEEND